MANAVGYSYNNTPSTGGGTLPVSAFSPDTAGKLYDGAEGDTATGYSVTSTQNGACFAYALIDLGPSPPTVSAARMTATQTGSADNVLVGSNDGTGWSNALAGSLPSGVNTSLSSPQTYRYYQAFTAVGGAAGSASSITDFRLYDGGGSLIGGPAAGGDFTLSVSPAPLTVGHWASATTTATVTSTGGFASPVTLSLSGLPLLDWKVTDTGGRVYFCDGSTVTPPAGGSKTACLLIEGANLPPGPYALSVSAQGGGKTHSYPVTLTVPAPALPPVTNCYGGYERQQDGSYHIALNWPAVDGCNRYRLYMGTGLLAPCQFWPTVMKAYEGADPQATITGLTAGATYTFWPASVDTNGVENRMSGAVGFTPPTG